MGKSTKKGAPGETGTTPVAEDLALGSTEPSSTPARVPDAVDPMDATVDIPEPKPRQPIVAAQDEPVTPSDREDPDDDSDEGSTMDLPPGGSVEDYSGIGLLRSSPGLGGSQSPTQSGVFPVASWDRYEFLQLLGRGGMGAVYKAKDLKIGRIVALKFVRGDDEHLIARFLQEARAQARIKHPSVCQVLEVGEVEGKPYIAMQFVDGMSLAQARQVLSIEEKAAVIRESAEALHAAHEAGIIHRDVKPANIMIEKRGDQIWHPVVMDFGIAREGTDTGITESGAVLGTDQAFSTSRRDGLSGSGRYLGGGSLGWAGC